MSCVMTIPQAGRKEPVGEFIKSQGWQNCLQTRARQRPRETGELVAQPELSAHCPPRTAVLTSGAHGSQP